MATTLERTARPRPADGPDRRVWDLAAAVVDPEVPVLTIEDLGVLRSAQVEPGGAVRIEITPTYSGCPAVDAIRDDITAALARAGYPDVTVATVLSPAWTTDWMSEAGRAKLESYGIAAPGRRADGVVGLGLGIRCPRCGSLHTREVSRFGSTSCKAHYVCQRCQEPFDYFKEH
ncbi:1,2-phenylacetyl-CoA epoxidase subunit PaaD [Microterricola viridarii]|uniref:Ring-1,2-phenylacetyl-CoA epoxidase subunit PaaD n=1 Tax=Microterricola viridarii TaxID=412690 RepID=A0A1H1REF4_9MICO|nr:1,2-phenylacetyl-CoA epoxidase subunit PaaD [Microterricola viridarii]SDS34065.1 ring-1,2-phenylacetyl-CoA epoxidase subunit PaaD [Microterricola viridarii]